MNKIWLVISWFLFSIFCIAMDHIFDMWIGYLALSVISYKIGKEWADDEHKN
jgi:hypothetical protein